jgi:hypothetical protein
MIILNVLCFLLIVSVDCSVARSRNAATGKSKIVLKKKIFFLIPEAGSGGEWDLE